MLLASLFLLDTGGQIAITLRLLSQTVWQEWAGTDGEVRYLVVSRQQLIHLTSLGRLSWFTRWAINQAPSMTKTRDLHRRRNRQREIVITEAGETFKNVVYFC